MRGALRRAAGGDAVGLRAGRGVLLLQQRLRPARPDDRDARRAVLGRVAARTADQPAPGHPDRHPAGGGHHAPGRRRAPRLRHPGPGLGPAAQRRPGRADHRHGRDLLTFARLHLDGGVTADGKRLLSEASVAAMQAPYAAIPEFSSPGSAIGLGWRLSGWGGRTIIGHDGDTVGQSAYLRIDPEAGLAACLLTNSAESETLYRELFNEVFGTLKGVTMPAPPHPAEGPPSVLPAADLESYAGRYERVSRRLEVSVRNGQLRMLLTMTGNLAAITGAEPEELILYPADSSGTRFVLRSGDDEPWVPLSFGQFGDGTPYIYMSGRVTPRVG